MTIPLVTASAAALLIFLGGMAAGCVATVVHDVRQEMSLERRLLEQKQRVVNATEQAIAEIAAEAKRREGGLE